MPPSQLKRLKASLREQGITGPQKSKKQKKSQSKNAGARAQKATALASIRESFNPFEFKHLSRPKKHDYVTAQPQNTKTKVLGRPGVTKSHGEETRRKTLLPEMSRKNKVGGIVDRRIGEDDPTMSLEDRMMARFEREQQRKRGGGNVFDLEEAEDEVELTHGGKTLRFDEGDIGEGDYDAASVSGSSDGEEDGFLKRKRRRDDEDVDAAEGAAEEQPERKKSKAEVMKEVIAKSKLHKYERQQQKEDDDDLRIELDKDLNEVLAALRGHINKQPAPEVPKEAAKPENAIHPDRAALLAGKSRDEVDKAYDARVRQLQLDARAKPTSRTRTSEEIAEEDAAKLRELEAKRLRRMRGEESEDEVEPTHTEREDAEEYDDAAAFNLASRISQSRPQGVEDEDDFLLDDLIASESEADISEASEDESDIEDDTMAVDDDQDDEFLEYVRPESAKREKATNGVPTVRSKLAYTYPCPRSHREILDLRDIAVTDLPTVIQRIRALYHPGLHADNKNKLADFACALVDHISYLTNQTPPAPLSVVESIVRHVHSLSKSYPSQVSTRFREHLKGIKDNLTPGQLTILVAIGSIYPTSDHFHQVVTPAITSMARWMGMAFPRSVHDVLVAALVGATCLHYQRISKRYIPELIRCIRLSLQCPQITKKLVAAHAQNALKAADLWSKSPAFIEIFTPLLDPLAQATQTNAVQRLKILIQQARLNRRPQELHHHRPLPIKTSIPKFEEEFDPNEHYDPDKERAEAARLRKEYKREKKGALRELRKDANFIAREQLREKKEKDRAYEEKYRKLVAEIQGEEGREAKEYEREKRARKRNR